MPPLLWAEFSIQFLIPAIFLVIWALNQVFGRSEAPPAAGPRDRVGPRPIPPGPSRAPQTGSRGQAPAGRPEGSRSSPSSTTRPGASRPTRRPPSRAGEASPSRSSAAAERPTEPLRRPMPGPVAMEEVYAIYDDDRVSPRTIDAPPRAPVSAEQLRPTPRISDAEVVPEVISGLDRLMGSGIDRGRLREAILLNEVLSPPVAIRRSRNRAPVPILGRPADGQGGGQSGSEGTGGVSPGELS